MVVVTLQPGDRTALQCVQRIVTAIGESAPSDVTDGRPTTDKALQAVNDSLLYIYYKTRWDFRLAWTTFDLDYNTIWYDLPVDWAEPAMDIPVYNGTALLEYIDLQSLIENYPDFRLFPSDAMYGFAVITQVAAYKAATEADPKYWTIWNDRMLLYPTPTEDWLTDNVSSLIVPYYRMPTEMVADGDLLDLPAHLWTAHHHLALAYLKQYVEMQDWQADEVRGERYLQWEINRRSMRHRKAKMFRSRY